MKVKVTVKKQKEPPVSDKKIEIGTDYIRLDSFLKLADAVQSGGHAKLVIQDGEVLVNGEPCVQRGKKIRPGDTVFFAQIRYEVVGPCG